MIDRSKTEKVSTDIKSLIDQCHNIFGMSHWWTDLINQTDHIKGQNLSVLWNSIMYAHIINSHNTINHANFQPCHLTTGLQNLVSEKNLPIRKSVCHYLRLWISTSAWYGVVSPRVEPSLFPQTSYLSSEKCTPLIRPAKSVLINNCLKD